MSSSRELLAKSTTACPSLFLFPNPCLPMHSSSPLFPSLTCPFRSAPTTILSFLGIFSTVSSRSSQTVYFSSPMHPTRGGYALITLNITPSSSIFKHIILSVTLHNSTTLSTCSFFNMISTSFFSFPLPQYHILYPPPMHLALSPFQKVSCTHRMSTPLCSIRSTTSLDLPVMVPTFNVVNLNLIFLAFFLSSLLCFLLLHCFPPLLCIQVACPPVTLGAQSMVTVVVFLGLDRSGMKSDFTTRIEKYLAMYAGCPSCRNPPHLSGLGTGTKAALI